MACMDSIKGLMNLFLVPPKVVISKTAFEYIMFVSGTTTFPSNFMLVAAMNQCPCGFYGDPAKDCTCSDSTPSGQGEVDCCPPTPASLP